MTSKGIIILGPFHGKNMAKAEELAGVFEYEKVERINARNLEYLQQKDFLNCCSKTEMIVLEQVNRYELLTSCFNFITRGIGLPGLIPPVTINPILVFVLAQDFDHNQLTGRGPSFDHRFLFHSVTMTNKELKILEDKIKMIEFNELIEAGFNSVIEYSDEEIKYVDHSFERDDSYFSCCSTLGPDGEIIKQTFSLNDRELSKQYTLSDLKKIVELLFKTT